MDPLNQRGCPNCRDRHAEVTQVTQQMEQMRMEADDKYSIYYSEKCDLREQLDGLTKQLVQVQGEDKNLQYQLRKTQEELAIAQRKSREVGALDPAELIRKNRDLINENLQLKEQLRRGQDGQLLQAQLEGYKKDFQSEREDKERAQATIRQLRVEIEARGREGDNALMQLQMNEFMKEFQSERDDKLKAQANARQLKQDKEQLKDLQDKMQGQIFNLERERDDLKKIIEILQADMGGGAQANNPQPQAANPVPVPNPIPNAVPNPIPNPP